jgi:hypothetical protein
MLIGQGQSVREKTPVIQAAVPAEGAEPVEAEEVFEDSPELVGAHSGEGE